MQIYGDSSCEITIAALVRALLSRVGEQSGLASLRAMLIACGQLEQLVADADQASEALRRGANLATDHAAAAFYATWSADHPSAPRPKWSIELELQQLGSTLTQLLGLVGSASGTLKLPEGFAFYAVYPEQYCAAAAAYVNQRGSARGINHVMGLRSIGTTLSAAVAVVLRAAEVAYERYTVRPFGHPFERRIELSKAFTKDDRALVVDEGPGLSGSSFFAASRALEERGVAATKQVYFCAHSEPPGEMASPQIRDFWHRARRYVASIHASPVTSQGSLSETLCAELKREFQGEVLGLDDLSRGQWRRAAFGEPQAWPAAWIAFERPKLLARLADGRRVFLKYYGQVLRAQPITHELDWSDAAAARQLARSVSKVAQIHGYVARLWLDGELLAAHEKSEAVLERLASFLADRSWQCVSEDLTAADAYYGASGSLAPREWIRLPNGVIRKLPETLPGYDHTAIDAEPLGWDLAGVVIEWNLTPVEAEQLLTLFCVRSGIRVRTADLSEHIRKYAGFHGALAQFCTTQSDIADSTRLENERVRYAAYENGSWP
jgi:hypothetical protein